MDHLWTVASRPGDDGWLRARRHGRSINSAAVRPGRTLIEISSATIGRARKSRRPFVTRPLSRARRGNEDAPATGGRATRTKSLSGRLNWPGLDAGAGRTMDKLRIRTGTRELERRSSRRRRSGRSPARKTRVIVISQWTARIWDVTTAKKKSATKSSLARSLTFLRLKSPSRYSTDIAATIRSSRNTPTI